MGRRCNRDVFLFLQILFFAAVVPILLRLKLWRVEALLEPKIQGMAERDRVEQIAAYVEIAIREGRPLVHPGCLTRGVTRYYFLRRDGLDVSLCFGVGRLQEEFVGHCWLVKDGVPFLETQDPRPVYTEMYRISGAARRGVKASGNAGLEQSRT
jgi:Transglutaminase-like superfamily